MIRTPHIRLPQAGALPRTPEYLRKEEAQFESNCWFCLAASASGPRAIAIGTFEKWGLA